MAHIRPITLCLCIVAACAPAPAHTLQIEGVAVDESLVQDAVSLVSALHIDGITALTADVGRGTTIRFAAGQSVDAEHPNRAGETSLAGEGSREITIAMRGQTCLARTALVHELMHIKYGDGDHALGPKVWSIAIYDINNKLMLAHCPDQVLDGGFR